MTEKIRVLILCTGNSARSQMAEGLLRHDGGENFVAESAGIAPSFVRPEAIEVMREIGIDISSHRSKPVDELMAKPFDWIITVCDNAKQNCPVIPGAARQLHWSLEDPAAVEGDVKTRLDAFRKIRDDLRKRLREFVAARKERREL
jgi:arsenate reductase